MSMVVQELDWYHGDYPLARRDLCEKYPGVDELAGVDRVLATCRATCSSKRSSKGGLKKQTAI